MLTADDVQEQVMALMDAVRGNPAIMAAAAEEGLEEVVILALLQDPVPPYAQLVETAAHGRTLTCLEHVIAHARSQREQNKLVDALADCDARVQLLDAESMADAIEGLLKEANRTTAASFRRKITNPEHWLFAVSIVSGVPCAD